MQWGNHTYVDRRAEYSCMISVCFVSIPNRIRDQRPSCLDMGKQAGHHKMSGGEALHQEALPVILERRASIRTHKGRSILLNLQHRAFQKSIPIFGLML